MRGGAFPGRMLLANPGGVRAGVRVGAPLPAAWWLPSALRASRSSPSRLRRVHLDPLRCDSGGQLSGNGGGVVWVTDGPRRGPTATARYPPPACAQGLAVSRPVTHPNEQQQRRHRSRPGGNPYPARWTDRSKHHPGRTRTGFGPSFQRDLATRSKFGAELAPGSKITEDLTVTEATDTCQPGFRTPPPTPKPPNPLPETTPGPHPDAATASGAGRAPSAFSEVSGRAEVGEAEGSPSTRGHRGEAFAPVRSRPPVDNPVG